MWKQGSRSGEFLFFILFEIVHKLLYIENSNPKVIITKDL